MFPVIPEIPKEFYPDLWFGFFVALVLSVAYVLQPSTTEQLALLAPSYNDLTPLKALAANFLHVNIFHLVGNCIAAVFFFRALQVFVRVYHIVGIFLVGGTIGIACSVLLSGFREPDVIHLGASGGILAVLGAYSVFNFQYRTRYLYIAFPLVVDLYSLPTNLLFVADVFILDFLMGVAVSMGAIATGIAHWGHACGFLVGAGIAYLYKSILNWPAWAQTRAEYCFVKASVPVSDRMNPSPAMLEKILEMNSYNDVAKRMLLEKLLDANDVNENVFALLTPSFVRHETSFVARFLSASGVNWPQPALDAWLNKMPYDLMLMISEKMVKVFGNVDAAKVLLQRYSYGNGRSESQRYQLDTLVRGVGLLSSSQSVSTPPDRIPGSF